MLEIRLEDRQGIITMNNDARRNVISTAFINDLVRAFNHFRHEHVRVVVLRANPGVKVWSAGHDVDELPPPGHDPLHWSDTLPHLVRLIQGFPAPVIAMIEGSVWGGACELAMACDIVVATRDTTFAITPAKLGLPYNINGLSTLTRLMSPHMLREMLFTAQPVSALRLAAAGAINDAVDAAVLEKHCYDMATRIAENSPHAIAVMKESMRAFIGRDLAVAEFERLQELRHEVYNSADYVEGLNAFRERRKPQFSGEIGNDN